MARILDPEQHYAVARDGLPRVGLYDDDSEQVLYLDGDLVRSMSTADWLAQRGPLPIEPTPAESTAAIAAREQARQVAEHTTQQLRQRILGSAHSAVGVSIDQLTVQQRNSLIALLLWKAGALDHEGKVRPLSEWIR